MDELSRRLPSDRPVAVRACLVGERLHLRGLYEPAAELGPLVLPAGAEGMVMLFRYGAVVFFNVTDAEQAPYINELRPRIERAQHRLEIEDTHVLLAIDRAEGVTADGIGLGDFSLARLRLVAIALARSVALAYYETMTAGAFDAIEPWALRLAPPTRGPRLRELLRHVGGALLVQHKMIGRVGIQDKPELLWEHPELDRLYLLMEQEYELRERATVLERKLDLIGHTAETAVNLLQNRSMLRVEWYIVVLIVLEVVLYSYEIWFK